MGDQIAIEPGLLPWQPAAGAELVETYHFYDMPLAGLVREGGCHFFFWCLEGHVGSLSLWAYARADEEDLVLLESTRDLDQAVAHFTPKRPLVVALSREGEGVVLSALIERDSGGSLVQGAIEIFRSVETELEDFEASATA